MSARPQKPTPPIGAAPKSHYRSVRPIDHERPHPLYVVWEITLACDLGCKHCGSRAGHQRTSELTTEQFIVVMSQSPDLARDHQSLLHDFLRRADLVKFARLMPPAEDIDESVQAAQRILAETRYRTEATDG